MNGTIINFKRGIHRTSPNQMIIQPETTKTKEEAQKLIGKKVIYNTGKKEMSGEIRSAHGNSGAIRVLFETGMPGQAIGQKVQIK
ncbi:50S ribosomal protein L35ae [Candidatus Woesearchaeota archaeon]|jgi:large subunit ribosomal protein L35Ae|nr:50S ribosomal protein L35ae [Candidatus Woesearchaeota archaeon]